MEYLVPLSVTLKAGRCLWTGQADRSEHRKLGGVSSPRFQI